MLVTASKATGTVALALFLMVWNIENPFWMGTPTSCAGFSNRLYVLGLPLLLRVTEGWNDWRLSLGMPMRPNG